MNPRKAVSLLAVLLFAFAPLAIAQGTYARINVPGATETLVYGINTAGDIVGCYKISGIEGGFLLSGGKLTLISHSNEGENTCLTGINDAGQIVGWTGDGYASANGFSYDLQAQTFTDFPPYPGSRQVFSSGVNNAGTIVGFALVCETQCNWEGFQLSGTTYTTIAWPGWTDTWATGINNSGEIVGLNPYTDESFLYNQGTFQQFRIPGRTGVSAYGINDTGAVVGFFPTGPHSRDRGFVYQNGIFTALLFPGSRSTYAIGINNSGVVVGYLYPQRYPRGFSWTPPASEHGGQR